MESESVESGDEPSHSDDEVHALIVNRGTKRKRSVSQAATEDSRMRESVEDGPFASTKPRLRRHIRLKGKYNDNYRLLLNSMILEANEAPHMSYEPSKKLDCSQKGVSIWTDEQKDALFHAIERYGRDDLPRIASIIEKSEQEVSEYLQLLKEGMLEYISLYPAGIPSTVSFAPAAVELSDQCCQSLEIAGEALSWYQKSWEDKQEQKEHGNYWLLDREVAEGLDESYSEDESASRGSAEPEETDTEGTLPRDTDERLETSDHHEQRSSTSTEDSNSLDPVPAANLLNLTNFINLSERVFMNSSDPEWNYRTHEDPKPTPKHKNQMQTVENGPSVFHSAFNDFHRLIVSITRRLVHVSLFQATTRLRATDSLTRKQRHKPAVRRSDVISALHIVGMKDDSIDYWAELPKRHKSNWILDKNSKRIPVSDVEAREFLSRPLKRTRPSDEEAGSELGKNKGAGPDLELEEDGSAGVSDQVENLAGFSSTEEDSDTEGAESRASSSETDHGQALEEANDHYLDILDTENSREEEKIMWALLQQEVPDTVDLSPPEVPGESPEPVLLKEYGGPQDQWRDWMDPQALWENDAIRGTDNTADGSSTGEDEEARRERSEVKSDHEHGR